MCLCVWWWWGEGGVARCSRCCRNLSTISAHEIDSFFLSVCLRVSTQVAIPPFTPFYICHVCVVLETLISCFICRLTSAPFNKKKKRTTKRKEKHSHRTVCRSSGQEAIGGRRGRGTSPSVGDFSSPDLIPSRSVMDSLQLQSDAFRRRQMSIKSRF